MTDALGQQRYSLGVSASEQKAQPHSVNDHPSHRLARNSRTRACAASMLIQGQSLASNPGLSSSAEVCGTSWLVTSTPVTAATAASADRV